MERAKALFRDGGYTCVLCRGDVTHTSGSKGVSPMVGFLTAGTDLNGFSAADKIVGKAAAMLFSLAGVKEVYAPVLSEQAAEVFARHNIKYFCDTLTPSIINRAGTGPCPMEQAVRDIDDPYTALEVVKKTLAALKENAKQGDV